MSILDTIKKDNLVARKAKNSFLSGVLTTLVGEITAVGKNNGNRETTDDEAVKVLQKFKKNAEQTISLLKDKDISGSELSSYEKEVSIYSGYLPSLMSEDELTYLIQDIISHDSDINLGKIMKFLNSQYKGQFDGRLASQIAKKLLP